ncbi:membrane-bound electron transfer flavoprotein:quinone oxidoreductase [Candidatus Sulfopaludibacter sp. SbA6]|nr:membrane-bound electron transfer flavoprotein:quinone oxidoreductase [Candidatus Sulfopaludibacter sp. SbA6]
MIADVIQSPAQATYWLIQGRVLFLVITLLGVVCFAYIVAKRMTPLMRGAPDFRFDRPLARLVKVLQFWLGQWRHPRYRTAGTIHLLIFAGFIILVIRAFSLLILAVSDHFVMPGGHLYDILKDYAATIVFFAVGIAAIRRLVFKPARYAKGNTADAIFLLALIGVLMAADSVFEASKAAAHAQTGQAVEFLATLSMPWVLKNALISASLPTLQHLNLGAFFTHEVTFFFLLCYRPFGIQFHVETSLFTIYFSKLDRETLKPVRWGVPDDQLDQVKSFGVKTFEDFTWKHMLDFYSCADCGRCSDQCPANAVGRPLSPRFLTTKARDYSFRHYPMLGRSNNGTALVGGIYSEDEIWSCTTCGACEAECPLLVEYIDKIVDLRRGMVDDGKVPQSLQKPLKSLESRGNPFGKMEKKRAEWAKANGFQQTCPVKILNGKESAETLYFVDSITSYDDRIQAIGRATAKILAQLGENFGILGAAEKDSGHEVRRFGEETLFMALRDHNTEAIRATGVRRIVTADPHAYNALKHDYRFVPEVEHISQTIARGVRAGRIQFNPVEYPDNVYAYHDPCYLGRHNQVYDDPREVLDAIPGLQRVEMQRSRDRSFCCGGGGLALFYEPKEEQRMGVRRVRMAAEAGANVMVTACPFCMVNVEDAIKVAGMEGKMTAIDLAELAGQQIAATPNRED